MKNNFFLKVHGIVANFKNPNISLYNKVKLIQYMEMCAKYLPSYCHLFQDDFIVSSLFQLWALLYIV